MREMGLFQEVLDRASRWKEKEGDLREKNKELKKKLRKAEARIDKLINRIILHQANVKEENIK